MVSGLVPVGKVISNDEHKDARSFYTVELEDFLKHVDDISESEVSDRLEHQFNLLDADQDGLLSKDERKEVWVDLLQPVAHRFFPDTDIITFDQFCEKDHHLAPYHLSGDEHFFTIEQVCQWEKDLSEQSCENDWELIFGQANEISRTAFIERFVEVLNDDKAWTFEMYEALMMGDERKHLRRIVFNSDEKSLVPINQYSRKSDHHCASQNLVSRRDLAFVISALVPIITIVLTSLVSATFSAIGAGCNGNCFDGEGFNWEAALIEGGIAFASSAFMGTTCVISAGTACLLAGVGTGVVKSIAQGTICELAPDDWEYTAGNNGCKQDCCWQPMTMLSTVATSSVSALFQTSAFSTGVDQMYSQGRIANSLLKMATSPKGMSSWSWQALANVNYGLSSVGSSLALSAGSHLALEEFPYLWELAQEKMNSQTLSEFKRIVLQPSPFSNQVSLLDAVRADIDAKNIGIPCGQYCSHSGQCGFCGSAYCCQRGVVSHGCDGSLGGETMRVCVPMTISEAAATMDSFREKEMIELQFTHVQLNNFPWCGTQNPYLPKNEVRMHWELKMPGELCLGSGGLTQEHGGALLNWFPTTANSRMIMSKAECIRAAAVFSNNALVTVHDDHAGNHPYGCSIKHSGGQRYPIWRTRAPDADPGTLPDSSRICYRHELVAAHAEWTEWWEDWCGYSPRPPCPDDSWTSSLEVYSSHRGSCFDLLKEYRLCGKNIFSCPSGYSLQTLNADDFNRPDLNSHWAIMPKDQYIAGSAFCRKDDTTWPTRAQDIDHNGLIIYPDVVPDQSDLFCADKGFELDISTEFETFDEAMSHCLLSASCGAVYEHKPLNCRFFMDVAFIEVMNGDNFDHLMPDACDYVKDAETGLNTNKFYAIKLTDPLDFCPIQSDPDARVGDFKTLRARGNFVMLEGKTYNGNTADCRDRYNYFTYYPATTDEQVAWEETDQGWANFAGFVHGFDVPTRGAGMAEVPEDQDYIFDADFVVDSMKGEEGDVKLSTVYPLVIPAESMKCTTHEWKEGEEFSCPEHSAIQGFFIFENDEISHLQCCKGVIQRTCHWEALSNPGRRECSNSGYVWSGMRANKNTLESVEAWLCCEVPPVIGNAALIKIGEACVDNAITEFKVSDVQGPTFNLVAPKVKQCHDACEDNARCTNFAYLPAVTTVNELGQVINEPGHCALFHSRCKSQEVNDNVLLYQMNKRLQILDVLSELKLLGCSLKNEATWKDIQEPIGHAISNLESHDIYACVQACSAHGYSIMTFEQRNAELTHCLCKDDEPTLVSCGTNLDVNIIGFEDNQEFSISSSPEIQTVYAITSVNKITAVSTNNGTLFVDIGRARFNELFDACPVVALNTADGQKVYRRTSDWTNDLDAYSLFTFEFYATGNIGADYVTYMCSDGSCEVQDVREWLDLEVIRSKEDNPNMDLFLFPAHKCPTNYDMNMAPCDPEPITLKIDEAIRLYGDKMVRVLDNSGTSFSITNLHDIPSLQTRDEITIAGEIAFEYVGCHWNCEPTGTVIENVGSRCSEFAIEQGADSFSIDSSGKCILFVEVPEMTAFDTCPSTLTGDTCLQEVFKRVTKWEKFQCSSFFPVTDKDSRVFQSCMNDEALTTTAENARECQLACDLLRGCSYFIFDETQLCLLYTTCDLSYERSTRLTTNSILLHRGIGDVENDQIPRFVGIDNQPKTMTIRSPDSRDEAFVSCPVGYIISSCACDLETCRGSSVSGRYCTAFGDFVAAEVQCLKETFVHSHGIITRDTVSFDCGSSTLLGCVCLSKKIGDCSVELINGRCYNTNEFDDFGDAGNFECTDSSCKSLHLQVFPGAMIQLEYNGGSRFSVPKGSYNPEAQRKMFPEDFVWKSDVGFLAVRVGDDTTVQGICADLDESFDDPTLEPTASPTSDSASTTTPETTFSPTINPTLEPTIDSSLDPTTRTPTFSSTVDPTTAIPTPTAPSRAPTDPNYTTTVQPTSDPTVSATIDSTLNPTTESTAARTPESTPNPSTNPTTESITLESGATTKMIVAQLMIMLIFIF
jgi:hypothetical protein